jgi:cytochrome c oxidase subunit 2
LEFNSCCCFGWFDLYGLYAWTNIMFVDEDEDTVVIEFAQQFNWKARYSGEDNVLVKQMLDILKVLMLLVLI